MERKQDGMKDVFWQYWEKYTIYQWTHDFDKKGVELFYSWLFYWKYSTLSLSGESLGGVLSDSIGKPFSYLLFFLFLIVLSSCFLSFPHACYSLPSLFSVFTISCHFLACTLSPCLQCANTELVKPLERKSGSRELAFTCDHNTPWYWRLDTEWTPLLLCKVKVEASEGRWKAV